MGCECFLSFPERGGNAETYPFTEFQLCWKPDASGHPVGLCLGDFRLVLQDGSCVSKTLWEPQNTFTGTSPTVSQLWARTAQGQGEYKLSLRAGDMGPPDAAVVVSSRSSLLLEKQQPVLLWVG